jgi:hypothetical protein
MGFNLGNVLAGAAVGFGQGMVQNAASQEKMEQERRMQEMAMKREEAMMKLQSQFRTQEADATYARTAQDRQFAQQLQTDEMALKRDELAQRKAQHDAVMADRAEKNALTADKTQAIRERDAARLDAQYARASAQSVASSKPTEKLTDVEKDSLQSYRERLKGAEKARDNSIDGNGAKAYDDIAKQAKLTHIQEMMALDAATPMKSNQGVVIRTKTGQSHLFRSVEEMEAAGITNLPQPVRDHFDSIKEKPKGKGDPIDAPTTTQTKKDAYSESDYARLAGNYGYDKMNESQLQSIIDSGQDHLRVNAANSVLERRKNKAKSDLERRKNKAASALNLMDIVQMYDGVTP